MIRYIIDRLIALAMTLFIIVSVAFFVVRLMPGSFVADKSIAPEVRKVLEDKYHLNEPLGVQYGYFLKDFVKLDFGTSYAIKPGVPVNDIIVSKIPETLRVNIYSSLLTIPFGLLFGVIAAIKKNTATDTVISTAVIICISVPQFIFAALLQYFLAFKLGWFPILVSHENVMSWNKFVSLILPTLALTFGPVAAITRFLRAELSEALNTDYMLLAKSKGLTHKQATIRHAIRNSFLPIIGMFIGLFTSILTGSLIIERIFGIPGMGMAQLDAINGKDYSVVIGCMFWYSLINLLTVLIVDLSYGIVDPRIRMGGKR